MIIYLNIGVVLFGSCSHVIMMTPKVDPHAERGVRMWNRDRLRKRVSFVVVFFVFVLGVDVG